MTVLARIDGRRKASATLEHRRQKRMAMVRVDEIVTVENIGDDYHRADRAGDLQMESWFSTAYQRAPDAEWQDFIVSGFLKWQSTERSEERVVSGSVEDAVTFLKRNNSIFLADGCGPDGRAA